MDRQPNKLRSNLVLTAAALIVVGLAAGVWSVQRAQACSFLDVPNEDANDRLCAELTTLSQGEPGPATRNVIAVDPDTQKILEEFQMMQDAYRADPKKTLELIARIREAGGLLTK